MFHLSLVIRFLVPLRIEMIHDGEREKKAHNWIEYIVWMIAKAGIVQMR